MATDCQDEANCLTEALSAYVSVTSHAQHGSARMSSIELVRELSRAAVQCRALDGDQAPPLIELDRWVRVAVEHVRECGVNTVDHIVLSGTLKTIVQEIPAVAGTLEREGWRWYRSQHQ